MIRPQLDNSTYKYNLLKMHLKIQQLAQYFDMIKQNVICVTNYPVMW